MIPSAVSNTDVHASLWSHLKSIDHALDRVLGNAELSELDRDRLNALVGLLQGELATTGQSPDPSASLGTYTVMPGPDFHSGIDLRRRLARVPEFEEWQKASKKGFDAKMKRLIQVIEDFRQSPASLFTSDVPREELNVLRAVVRALLAEAETALY